MTNIPDIIGEGVLGKQAQGPRRSLDVFELPPNIQEVKYTSDEVMSICPITGQPDWYVVEIHLQNTRFGIESKSLKLYLQSFREDGQFCEAFCNTITNDVFKAVKDIGSVMVRLVQKSRGGVSIDSLAWKG